MANITSSLAIRKNNNPTYFTAIFKINLFRFLCPSLGQEIQRRQLVAMKSPWERCNQSL